MIKFTDMVNESKRTDSDYVHDKGCIMMGFKMDNWKDILGEIKAEDVFEGDGKGLEDEPHITLLCGLLHGVETADVKKIFENIPQPYIELKNITIFQNTEFDVVKFDIECDLLRAINGQLSELFPNENTHPDYHPHMTIAYLKAGRGVSYIKTLEKTIVLKPSRIFYSVPTGTTKGETVDLRKW